MKASGTGEAERTWTPPESVLDCTLTRCLETKQDLLPGSQMPWFVCQCLKSVPSITIFSSDLLLCAYVIWCLLFGSVSRGEKPDAWFWKHTGLELWWLCAFGSCWNTSTDVAATATLHQIKTKQNLLPQKHYQWSGEGISAWPFYLCGLQHAVFVGKTKTQGVSCSWICQVCGFSAVSVIYYSEEGRRGHPSSRFWDPLQCSSFGLHFLLVLVIFLSLFISPILVKEPAGI